MGNPSMQTGSTCVCSGPQVCTEFYISVQHLKIRGSHVKILIPGLLEEVMGLPVGAPDIALRLAAQRHLG